MGYGHQRAAYPLKDIAYERIITANSDKIVTEQEKKTWHKFQVSYEGISRLRSLPVIGEFLWNAYDKFQAVSPYYPFRDLSKPNFGSIYLHKLIRKGFVSSVVDYTKKKNLPFVTTFFVPAVAAAHAKLKDVYCIVTDTDISRIWVPEHPAKERIYYLTPAEHSTKRLIAYGIPEKNIFFTGFPLPKENTGQNMEILKHDLGERLPNLDPKRIYISSYREVIKKRLGRYYKTRSNHPLTLTFAVGGAGAQKELADSIMHSLKNKIIQHRIRINLIAGTHPEVEQYFKGIVHELGLNNELGKYVNVLCTIDNAKYLKDFNEILHTTDILWTKPSELAFYVALGIPIIIAPPLGSHEIMNMKWLVRMGTGYQQEDPKYTDEWLFEWIEKGILAEAAWEGMNEAPKYGTYNAEKVIFSKNKKNLKLKY
jgi:UDP-N-acetylglucosamine:LPS N-acetylglucosamine transferase